jgi:hypothetical protein
MIAEKDLELVCKKLFGRLFDRNALINKYGSKGGRFLPKRRSSGFWASLLRRLK